MLAVHVLGWCTVAFGVLAIVAAIAHSVRPTMRTLATAIAVIVIAAVFGILRTIVLVYVVSAAGDPTRKATVFVESLSGALNSAIPAIGVLALWVVPFIIGEVRRERSGGDGDPTR